MINRAYQVDPGCQESNFDFACYSDIVFLGNRNFQGNGESDYGDCTEKLRDIEHVIEEVGYDKPNFKPESINLDEWGDILSKVGFARGKDEEQYNDEELRQFRDLYLRWGALSEAYLTARKTDIDRPRCARELREFEEGLELALYGLWKGREYDTMTLRGHCQGEWIDIVYPKTEYCHEQLRAIESEYFNTGTEWVIKSGEHEPDCEGAPECACEDNWDSFHCYVCDNEDIRSTLQGCLAEGEALEIYEFDGYHQIMKYKRYE